MTRQTTSSITSSIVQEEARSTTILGIARPMAILGTTKRQCLHVFTLDLYGRDLVYGCYVVYIWM
jgi:hypothetical protein